MQDIDEAGEVLLEGGRSTCVCVWIISYDSRTLVHISETNWA
jgi:hypothetical protein